MPDMVARRLGADRAARAGRRALLGGRHRLRDAPPDPAPDVFGYHEVFHALVAAAATMHCAAVALTILPSA